MRSRRVERNETDPACRTHIGPWGIRSASESRVGGVEGSQSTVSGEKGGDSQYRLEDACKLTGGRDRECICNTSDKERNKELVEYDMEQGASAVGEGMNQTSQPSAPPLYSGPPEEVMLTALTDIVQLLRQGQSLKHVPSARSISDAVVGLKKFSGSASDRESVESWLDEFLRYAEFRSLSPAERLQLFKILMRDSASDWLSTLDQSKTATWDALIREFKATYFKSPELKWAQARDLFNDPMRAGERVDDFVIRIKRAAKRLNIGDEIVHFSVINGLLPSLRERVLAKGVTSLEETLKTARIAECSIQTDPVHSLLLDTLKSNKELAQKQETAINTLTEKLKTLLEPDVTVMGDNDRNLTNYRAPSRNDYLPSNVDRNHVSTGTRNQPTQQPFGNRRVVRPTPRRTQMNNYVRQQQQMNDRFYQQGPVINSSVCRNCLRQHDRGVQCPAYGKVCNACGQFNHYSRACRSGRRI